MLNELDVRAGVDITSEFLETGDSDGSMRGSKMSRDRSSWIEPAIVLSSAAAGIITKKVLKRKRSV